jgi:hypothetical protein
LGLVQFSHNQQNCAKIEHLFNNRLRNLLEEYRMSRAQLYDLQHIRTLALYTQNLTTADQNMPTNVKNLFAHLQQVACIQLDTLQMVARSQYIHVWSRFGTYDPADLDRLAYQDSPTPNGRRAFEYWFHAMCLIPLEEYRYVLPIMDKFREHRAWVRWLKKDDNRALVDQVRARIKAEGGLRGSDFDNPDEKRGAWWDWKPAKRALEYLYDCGALMIANRVKFQRVYDLRERVLPDWVDTTPPTWEEMCHYLLEKGMKSFGVCQPNQVSDYFHDIKRGEARQYIETFIKTGIFVPIKTTLYNGTTADLVVHRDHLPILEQIADGVIKAERTTFLSPFDSLFYAQKRDQQLWGFQQVLEAYKPGPQRKWGYFCLPILHRDELMGRFDVKLERKEKRLRLIALYLEDGRTLSDEFLHAMAQALHDFMRFHGADEVHIERSEPDTFGPRLLAAWQALNYQNWAK